MDTCSVCYLDPRALIAFSTQHFLPVYGISSMTRANSRVILDALRRL